MKKVLISILILVLIVGAGVGGFFIGKNVKGDGSTSAVTKEAVVEVLDNFSYGAGWIEKENSTAKATSNVQPYEEDVLDYNGYDDLIKAYIFFTKYALLNTDVQEKEFYYSTATYKMDATQYTGNMGFYYEFGANCAFISIHDFDSDITVTIIVDIQPVQDNTYVMNILTDKGMVNKSYQEGFTIQQLYMDQYANQIYSYSSFTANTSKTNLTDITIDDVGDMHLFGCDIRTNQSINIYKDEIATEETYNFDALMNVYKEQVSRYSGVLFGDRDYGEIDALAKAYTDLGYQVI